MSTIRGDGGRVPERVSAARVYSSTPGRLCLLPICLQLQGVDLAPDARSSDSVSGDAALQMTLRFR